MTAASLRDFKRLCDKFTVGDGCWEWRAGLTTNGYGQFWLNGRYHRAHRVVYEMLVAPIPDGYELDHTCHNNDASCLGGPSCRHHRCVNPGHCEPTSHLLNVQRGRVSQRSGANERAKTHCPQGHPYSGDNLYVAARGWRYCRTCRAENQRKRDAAKRATR